MAVQSDTSRISYAGNNSTTTSYAVPFVFLENSHLKAIAKTSAGVETVVTLTNHTGAGNVNGGTVRTAVAIPATSTLTIYRDVPITQTTTYAEGGDFPAASHERALDKLTQISQQNARKLGSALRLSEANQIGELNPPLTNQQHILSSVGGAPPSWQALPSLSIGPVIATGSTTARSVQDRFADVVNVKNFGAVGNGVADDTAAIQSAINNTSPWGTIFIPEGVYRVTSTITLPASSGLNGLKIAGIGNGTVIKPASGVTTVFDALGDFASFDSLQIDGSLTSGAIGIVFRGDNNNNYVSVTNCFFGTISIGIQLRTDSWTVARCQFTNATTAIDCANWAMNGSCYDNYTLGGTTSIRLRTDTGAASPQQPEGVRIFSNCFLNTATGARAIDIRSGLEVSIFNNIIDQTGSAGFAIYAQPDSGQTISHLKIRDNWLKAGPTASGYGVWVSMGSGNNANNVFLEGNTITSTTVASTGIAMTNVSGYWVTNNHFYGTGTNTLTNPLVIVTSNFGTVLGNKGLSTEAPNVDNNALRGQLLVSNNTTVTGITAKSGAVEARITANLTGSGAGTLGTGSNHDLYIQTNNANRMFVASGGQIAPAADNATNLGEPTFRWASVYAANGTIQTSDERDKTNIVPTALGLDFIKSLNPVSYKWTVGGHRVVGAEEDGTPIVEPRAGSRTHHGLLAQEVKAALPDGVDFGGWVLTDKDDPDSQQALRYDQFIAPLIKAVQELSARVEELENQ